MARSHHVNRSYFRRRKFLAPDVDSYLRGSVSISKYRMVDDEKHTYRDNVDISASLKLADCYRSIEWSFDEDDDGKLRNIEDFVRDFAKAVRLAVKYHKTHHMPHYVNDTKRRQKLAADSTPTEPKVIRRRRLA